MNVRVYECLFLFDSNKYARGPEAVVGQIEKIVEKCGGEMLVSRLWAEQKLAYPIDGQKKGTYWLTFFRMDSEQLTTFNRECQLNENIMRQLVIRHDPRLVDALLAHARGEAVPHDESEEEAGDAGEPVEAAAEGEE